MIRKQFGDRKSIRLSEHDYSSSCLYFVTICVDWYTECLGSIHDQVMDLNEYGKIVEQQWLWLAKQYSYIELDEYVVMPNHFHGIIIINDAIDTTKQIAPLTEIIGAFKSTSSKFIHRSGLTEFKWQRSFHDKIIRDLVALDNMRMYIHDNPSHSGSGS
jgi:putative transposase